MKIRLLMHLKNYGSEYSISFFNKISSITQDKKILGFVNRFYKIRERKQGTILKLHRGQRTLHTYSLFNCCSD